MSEWTKFNKKDSSTWPSNKKVVMIAWREDDKDGWNNAICKYVGFTSDMWSGLEAIGVGGYDSEQDWDFGWVQEVYWKPYDIQHP